MVKLKVPKQLCKQILGLNKNIRVAAILSKTGKLVMIEYRKGTSHFLVGEEQEVFSKRAAHKEQTLETINKLFYEKKLGKIVYTSTLYENVKRVAIPLSSSMLLLAFDKEANHESIILKKIIPFVKKHNY
ncbi:MAG: hypothetical protein ACE5J2_03785 [Nitrososphaerales archaeon]